MVSKMSFNTHSNKLYVISDNYNKNVHIHALCFKIFKEFDQRETFCVQSLRAHFQKRNHCVKKDNFVFSNVF